jgi:hypothetical protein
MIVIIINSQWPFQEVSDSCMVNMYLESMECCDGRNCRLPRFQSLLNCRAANVDGFCIEQLATVIWISCMQIWIGVASVAVILLADHWRIVWLVTALSTVLVVVAPFAFKCIKHLCRCSSWSSRVPPLSTCQDQVYAGTPWPASV